MGILECLFGTPDTSGNPSAQREDPKSTIEINGNVAFITTKYGTRITLDLSKVSSVHMYATKAYNYYYTVVINLTDREKIEYTFEWDKWTPREIEKCVNEALKTWLREKQNGNTKNP